MATRIRYDKPKDGMLYSKQFYVTDAGVRLFVRIHVNSQNVKSFPWQVLEDGTTRLVGEGVAVNLHQAKIRAKKKLEELGIKFESESREEREVVQQAE